MDILVKKLSDKAVLPRRMSEGAAGFDLVATDNGTFLASYDSTVEYDTGIAVAIPDGYVGLLFPRSSISNSQWSLANSVGVIDSDYRGPIKLRFRYHGVKHGIEVTHDDVPYSVGDRIGQLVITPAPTVYFEEVDDLDDTTRAYGGFGSTDD